MSSTRQLAVIMFTDIVGYTAMMGQDERKAIDLIRVNIEIQKPLVKSHKGKWLKEIGDGTLCQFSSAFDAVSCALEIQRATAANLDAKLRIGIHLGDITNEGGEIYGDGVNIASRLESCAIPGSIFVSESVKKAFGGDTQFEFKDIGKIPLKNVKAPVQTYYVNEPSLAIPTKADIKKLTEKGKASALRIAIISVVVIGMISFAGWWYQSEQKTVISTDNIALQDARIAILPFENNTNDPYLDMLGEMAADWITRGLLNLGDIEVVSLATVKEHIVFANVSAVNQEGPSFFDRTGADKIIEGSFYEQNDQIYFHCQLIDVKSGKIERVFPEIIGDKTNLNEIVVELQKRIMALFMREQWETNYQTPNYEAYKLYQEGLKYYGTDNKLLRELMTESIELDSAYFSPYAWILDTYQYSPQPYDSVLTIVKQRFSQSGPWETAFINYLVARVDGSYQTTYDAVKKLYLRDPKNYVWNFKMGRITSKLNKPHEAIMIYEKIDPKAINYTYGFEGAWNEQLAYNLIRIRDLEGALEILSYVPPEFVSLWQIQLAVAARILDGEEENLIDFVNQIEQKGKLSWDRISAIYITISETFALINDQENHQRWNQLLRERVALYPEEINLRSKSRLAFLLEDYQETLSLTNQLNEEIGINWIRMARMGSSYAHLGRAENALEMIEQLDSLGTGGAKYGAALIHAALDNKEQAVANLNQALAMDMGPWSTGYDLDYELASLHGYGPFDEIAFPEL